MYQLQIYLYKTLERQEFKVNLKSSCGTICRLQELKVLVGKCTTAHNFYQWIYTSFVCITLLLPFRMRLKLLHKPRFVSTVYVGYKIPIPFNTKTKQSFWNDMSLINNETCFTTEHWLKITFFTPSNTNCKACTLVAVYNCI